MPNCWVEAEAELATADLPNLTAFQAFCGVGTPAAAAPYISREELASTYALTKWAIVSSADSNGFEMYERSNGTFGPSGRLTLRIGRMANPGDRSADMVAFKTSINAIMDELCNYKIGVGGFSIRSWLVQKGPFRTEETNVASEGDRIRVNLVISWKQI